MNHRKAVDEFRFTALVNSTPASVEVWRIMSERIRALENEIAALRGEKPNAPVEVAP
jgi:hypothetical protein